MSKVILPFGPPQDDGDDPLGDNIYTYEGWRAFIKREKPSPPLVLTRELYAHLPQTGKEAYDEARKMHEQTEATFVEIFVATSLEDCEERDTKGLYAKARSGEIKEFTGISDPYEEPENPEIRVETAGKTPEESAQDILAYLESDGLISKN